MQGIKRKKKSNRRPAAILLMLLVMQMSYAGNGSRSPNSSEPKYGIDLTKNYSGKEVQALIDIVVEEAEISIDEAFNAGYKQGILAYKPDAEYWKVKAQGFEKELRKKTIKNWMFCLSGVSIGFLGGIGLGIGLRLSY